jgi:uncharacterized SAM-binding protein YcdF (DUF218 family)
MDVTAPRRLPAGLRKLMVNILAIPLEPWVLRPGRRWQPTTTDCIVVPGAAVSADGSPSGFLSARVANAVALYRNGLSPHIVFTGGPRHGGPPEAEVALALALAAGLPASDLHKETGSRNTLENLLHARDLMASHGWTTCLISTDPVHLRRCLWIARDLGLRACPAPAFASPGYTDRRLRRWFVAYECRALLRYAFHRVAAASGSRRR